MRKQNGFNSTTVQLIQEKGETKWLQKQCFNSTTVQLIQRGKNGVTWFGRSFQFHNGTINTQRLSSVIGQNSVSIPQQLIH